MMSCGITRGLQVTEPPLPLTPRCRPPNISMPSLPYALCAVKLIASTTLFVTSVTEGTLGMAML